MTVQPPPWKKNPDNINYFPHPGPGDPYVQALWGNQYGRRFQPTTQTNKQTNILSIGLFQKYYRMTDGRKNELLFDN